MEELASEDEEEDKEPHILTVKMVFDELEIVCAETFQATYWKSLEDLHHILRGIENAVNFFNHRRVTFWASRLREINLINNPEFKRAAMHLLQKQMKSEEELKSSIDFIKTNYIDSEMRLPYMIPHIEKVSFELEKGDLLKEQHLHNK